MQLLLQYTSRSREGAAGLWEPRPCSLRCCSPSSLAIRLPMISSTSSASTTSLPLYVYAPCQSIHTVKNPLSAVACCCCSLRLRTMANRADNNNIFNHHTRRSPTSYCYGTGSRIYPMNGSSSRNQVYHRGASPSVLRFSSPGASAELHTVKSIV